MDEDRISQLPQSILHHILSFLSQIDAVKTSVLSKSWRYLGPTRLKIEFHEEFFNGDKQTFLSVIDSTLQRYHDQNLSIQEFFICMWMLDLQSVLLLEKWIPVIILNMRVKTFHICLHSQESDLFHLPSLVLQSESIENLYLGRCKLKKDSVDDLMLKHLHTLYLAGVCIGEKTLENILTSCPLIENVSLFGCSGFKTISVKNSCNLKNFSFGDGYDLYKKENCHLSIEINAPTIRTIGITGCPNWINHHKYYPFLKSLFLNRVKLFRMSFVFFSSNYLPVLEYLTLDSCNGFNEFHLDLSDSFEHLTIRNLEDKFIKAVIHAPKIVEFVYEGEIPQLEISFTEPSGEWKSHVVLSSYSDLNNEALSWLHKLSRLLKGLCESEISLELVQHRRKNQPKSQEVPPSLLLSDDYYRGLFKPVVIKHLTLKGYYSCSSFPAFLNCLFFVSRPRYVGQFLYFNAQTDWEKEDKDLNECFLEFLLMKAETRKFSWPQDLEDISMVEPLDQQESKPGKLEKVCFHLNWRES